VNITHTLRNLDHPLDKIFEGIPARSADFAHASVRHYPVFSNRLDMMEMLEYYETPFGFNIPNIL